MALDFVLDVDSKRPESDRFVPLEQYEHLELMRLAERFQLRLLLRMFDFYADVIFAPHELDSLIRELTQVTESPSASEELRMALEKLRDLVREASTLRCSVRGCAD